jgi:hypothetical protein
MNTTKTTNATSTLSVAATADDAAKLIDAEKAPFVDLASAIASAVTRVDDPDMA